jgi:uracil-DNA glycosylase
VFHRGRLDGSARLLKNDASIIAYRNRWFDALLAGNVQGVVALGQLADGAWQAWRATPSGAGFTGV